MDERHLSSALAKARDELFDTDRVMQTSMYSEPAIIVEEMVREIQLLRNDFSQVSEMHRFTIFELQRIRELLDNSSDPYDMMVARMVVDNLEESFLNYVSKQNI